MSQNANSAGNSDYYAARAVEERRLAMAAKDSKVREIHLEMADKYAALAESADAAPLHSAGDGLRSA